MERVIGVGGIFFKAQNPEKLRDWYKKHLGMNPDEYGSVVFEWNHQNSEKKGHTVWSLFPKDTDYFKPSDAPFMINYRVADLAKLLEQLRKEGVEVDDKVEEYEYGRFGWIMDPEGNRIELWEPPENTDWKDVLPMR